MKTKIIDIPALIIHVKGEEERRKNIDHQIGEGVFKNISIFDAYTPNNLKERRPDIYDRYFEIFGSGDRNHSKDYVFKNCCLTLSHLEIIKIAQKSNFDSVIIFEDDFNIKDKNGEINNFEIECPFNLFQIGGYYQPSVIEETEDLSIFKIRECFSSFGYIVHSSFYSTFIDKIENEYSLECFATDSFLARKIYNSFDCFVRLPTFINTIAAKSILKGGQEDPYSFFNRISEINK